MHARRKGSTPGDTTTTVNSATAQAEKIATEIIDTFGISERVSTLPGDYHETSFPTDHDVVLISGVLHRESESGCRKLIARAADALRSGGLLIVSDVMTDDSGCSPPFATLFGVNMMLTAPDGGVHSSASIADWMEEAGLSRPSCKPFPPPMPHRVILGEKR